ncbi:Response regulator rcp1 [Planctomycetes bacterium CA13]|uniref:Response regulator rcp1 n=1 Tax=Novipirellula herctigrandis TaxID=2527986 RepID=A0A5C5YMW5_9BACT|nr:Response regulator rcp1 [Planctomycetes bacterium CA13]
MLAASRVKPMEILLVEDSLLDARVTIHSLRRSQVHHRLTLVRCVREALMFLNQEGVFARAPRPDLLLLDLNLPDGSGIDVLEWLQNGDVTIDQVTTVVLTANEDDEMRFRCRELGVHDYIQKPVHEDEFMRVVRDHKRLMVHSAQQLATLL